MSLFLGIDIGTSGTKTLVINEEGRILASATAGYPCHVPQPLWSEQDPEDWWSAVVATVRAVMFKGKFQPGDVRAIGLSGQMHGSVFLDKSDRVLRRAILWNDQRTASECGEIETLAGGREKLIGMVSNPAMTGFTAPKILWLRNHEPDLYEKTAKILLPKDEIRRRLIGDYVSEVSDASGTLLLDVANRCWSKPLLTALSLDESVLPRLVESEDVTGSLTESAAAALGLTTNCLVVGGAGDCAAGALGNGIVRQGILSTSIGTSGVVFVHSDEVKTDSGGRVHTFCHAVRGKWHMMGVTLASGGSLAWFRNALCESLVEKAKQERVDVYELLTREAAGTRVGSDGLFFLPYLSGERTPHADPFARGAFIGLTLAHTRGHLVRAIMEGVTYSLRDSLEIFRSLAVPVSEIRASGGGARSPFWRQMQADVFDTPVVTTNSEEGAAYGVALLAGVGGGAWSRIEEACDACVSVVSTTEATKAAAAEYDRAFPEYRQLYLSLRDDFRRIAELD
ncbi:MAG: xylulokinase [Planctomycetia bacterium]|nr:xylulokinase [Planctomycetia bacterium]